MHGMPSPLAQAHATDKATRMSLNMTIACWASVVPMDQAPQELAQVT